MSEFWNRKLRTYFKKVDVNNDGFISKKDAEEMGDHLCDAANIGIGTEKRDQIRESFVEVSSLS